MPEKKTISGTVPAGVDDGSRRRLRGEGEAGPPGIKPGDLYVFIHVYMRLYVFLCVYVCL